MYLWQYGKIEEELLKVKTEIAITSQNIQQNKLNVRVKLPNLTVRKSDGDQNKWPEFWYSYKDSIYENQSLSEMDKFGYLKASLKEMTKVK